MKQSKIETFDYYSNIFSKICKCQYICLSNIIIGFHYLCYISHGKAVTKGF